MRFSLWVASDPTVDPEQLRFIEAEIVRTLRPPEGKINQPRLDQLNPFEEFPELGARTNLYRAAEDHLPLPLLPLTPEELLPLQVVLADRLQAALDERYVEGKPR